MRRGTTPTLKIHVKGIDLSELQTIYVTIKQSNKEVTKSGYDLLIDEDVIYVPLSQEDTLTFDRSCAWVQMRATTKEGMAIASNIRMLKMEEILKDGVITCYLWKQLLIWK